jgi:beta-lactamase superfamily II metal-dependent hydrolase
MMTLATGAIYNMPQQLDLTLSDDPNRFTDPKRGQLTMKIKMRQLCVLVIALLCGSLAFGQANGKLQIHFIDVGQGDGAALISPEGEVALFDHGVLNKCDRPVSYLQQLGVTKIDYLITSHYHSDHIGCTTQILQQFMLQKDAIDRGDSYTSATFQRYADAVGAHRRTAASNETITLDANSAHPVRITIVALNGDGADTSDENSLSLVALITFGNFHAEIGGDLVGVANRGAVDVETQVAPRVGPVDVYKVHHHCSKYSTNDQWVAMTIPTIAIVSAGDGNPYGHPTAECLDRLHSVGTKTYWTENGAGANPDPAFDVVAGNIVVETEFATSGQTFTVTYNGAPADVYAVR